jgi:hypothetical protein
MRLGNILRIPYIYNHFKKLKTNASYFYDLDRSLCITVTLGIKYQRNNFPNANTVRL